jgi:hypothetical protein
MPPPTIRNPRAIPGLVTEDTTPPPHELGAGAHLAWNHAENIGARVAIALGEQIAELVGKVDALATAAPVPPPAPPPKPQLGLALQTLGIVLALLGVAFVLYRQLSELAVKVETIGQAQQRGAEETQHQLDRFEDRLYNLAGPKAVPLAPGP